MKRRDFITLAGGAVAWPLAARAQQGDRVRRIGVLPQLVEADSFDDLAAFREALAKLGWIEDRNLRVDVRFGVDPERIRTVAAELVDLAPDVIVTAGAVTTREMQRQTQTIPIVIAGVGDPSANGIIKNIAHPEGNITGITNLFASVGGKWLELLKQAFPKIETVGLIYNTQLNAVPGGYYISSVEEAARALTIKLIKLPYQDAVDVTHGIDEFAAEPNRGLIVLPPPATPANRAVIRRLAAQHHLPAIWFDKQYVVEGGLLGYGSNDPDRWRHAASFVDRLLRGAKVSELPLEFPTRFELLINLRTAKAIGLTIPEAFLARADEVIE
jgi:putative ABC transport system substrate-binding protein